MSRCRLNERILSIILCNINNRKTLKHSNITIIILKNNNTLHKGGVETLEVKGNNKEEELVKDEAKSYVIIMCIQYICPEIVKVLWKIIHIVNHLIRLSNSVHK